MTWMNGARTLIDEGLPEGRASWPPGLLEHLQAFSQGDVIERPPFLYYADLRYPVWARTAAYAAAGFEQPEEVILPNDETAPQFGVITTQTCDIVEEDAQQPSRPWVQVAPVYNGADIINSGMRKLLERGRGPRYLFHMSDMPEAGFWVADLRIEVPVEKGWLLGREPIKALPGPAARARFSERVGKLRARPAFAGRFVGTVQVPLLQRLSALKQSDPDLFARLDEEIIEARVQLDDPLAPHSAQVVFLGDDIGETTRAWLDGWWDDQVHTATEAGLDLLPNDYRSLNEMTAAEYRGLIELPLDRVSPE